VRVITNTRLFPPRLRRSAAVACAVLAVTRLDAVDLPARPGLPEPLRGVDPRRISGGVYASLVGSGAYGPVAPAAGADLAGLAPASGIKGTPPAILDARVAPSLRLGVSPPAVAPDSDQQAEPFVFRSIGNPDLVLATFQQGRFGGSEGGAADGSYALSTDGGFTWTRALTPGLSQLSGGAYYRSTDPVSAIDLQGDLFLSTLDARDSLFTLDDLVVSRSLDGGATWTNHVAYSTPNAQLFADKDWLAVNDYAGTPNAGRLVATFTGFSSNAAGETTGDTLFSVESDDQGTTWSQATAITPSGGNYQGTQPFFLPDGTLICIYQDYASGTGLTFQLECRRSLDGGRTWPSAPVVVAPGLTEFDDPVARTGGGLPAVAVARQTGAIFTVWQAVAADGSARIFVTKSTDEGATWAPAQIVSDNPPNVSVFNPAVAVTPDGSTVSVVFYDKRLAPDLLNYVDLFAAQSFDGGATWQPEVRVSDFTTDLRLAQLSDTGYMLGDYLGLAPALTPSEGTIPIWCDTRFGFSEPFISRVAPAPTPGFQAWQTVRFTSQEQADPAESGPSADFDGDGYSNFAEYALGTDPRVAESGATLATSSAPQGADTGFSVSWTQRTTADFAARLEASADGGLTWQTQPGIIATTGSGATQTASATLSIPAAVPTQVRLVIQQTSTGSDSVVPDIVVANGASRLTNLSCRGPVGSGASQLIAGFVTAGGPKSLLIRAAGPALAAFGVADPLSDPFLTLQAASSGTVVAVDDNWQDNGAGPAVQQAEARVGAFPFSPGSLDSALVAPLGAGAYTAAVSGSAGSTGSITLAEIYDLDPPGSVGKMINVSTRGSVGTGSSVMIAGFAIAGPQPKRVLVRASGPALAEFGVAGTLPDPQITIYNSDGTAVASNDDWMIVRDPAVTEATAARVGAFAFGAGSLDAAVVVTLPPGAYTAVVSGVSSGTGNALVEVYDAD